MNRPSPGLRPPSPRLAGRGQGEGCQSGSWPQLTSNFWRCSLPINRTPSSRPSPPMGEKVPGGRLRGIPTGSWLRFTSGFWRLFPTNEPGSRGRQSAHSQIVSAHSWHSWNDEVEGTAKHANHTKTDRKRAFHFLCVAHFRVTAIPC